MSIELNWEKPGEILRVDFHEEWTVDEYTQCVEAANQQVAASPNPITVILNYDDSTIFPRTNAFDLAKATSAAMPQNVKRIYITGGSQFARAIVSTFFKVTQSQFKRRGVDVSILDSLDAVRDQIERGASGGGMSLFS